MFCKFIKRNSYNVFIALLKEHYVDSLFDGINCKIYEYLNSRLEIDVKRFLAILVDPIHSTLYNIQYTLY